MAEYIEREALSAEVYKLRMEAFRNNDQKACGCYNNAYVAIVKAPAADVAPVVHGRWIPFHSTAAGDIQYCSACEIGCTWKPNYCPNCGADMRGGNDE